MGKPQEKIQLLQLITPHVSQSRPRHNRTEKLLYWGWVIEIMTAILCYLSAALMFFALGFVSVTWTLVTVLTGVCATKR